MKKSNLRMTAALQVLAFAGAGLPAAFIAATPAAAQDVTAATLSGTVTDEAGASISGATVTIRNDAGVTRSTTTNSSGAFTIGNIPPGLYDVTISSAGRPNSLNQGVDVAISGTNYTFVVANASASGSGDAGATVVGRRTKAIDFSGTATGQVFNVQQTAQQLPISRSIEAIQLLTPQTTTGDNAFGGVSIGGSSVAENIYYINGMNITNFRTFVGGTTVPFEFYDQVQVKTGGYQAEFGRNTGGAVIALTRSGSNDWKGGLNVSYSPNMLRSNSPDTYAGNNDKDIRRSAEGNVWVSGPLIKDRAFIFAFVNPRYSYQSDTSQNCDPGTFENCVDTTTTTARLNDPFWGGKMDVNLFEGHRLEGTYFSDKQNQDVKVDGSPTTNFAGGKNIILKYTGAFTDWFTLSALYGTSEYNQTSAGASDSTPYVLDGRSGTLQYVAGNPAGTIETGEDRRKNYRMDADFNFNAFGKHRVRAGFDYELLNAKNDTLYSGGVYYRYYNSGATPDTYTGGVVPANTDYVRVRTLFSGGSFDSKNTAFYIQDSWDVTDRINLSLGVRNDRFTNYNAQGVKFTDLKNQWAPRLGINVDPFGDKRTRLSAFYGRYYLPVAANTNIRLAGDEQFIETYYRLAPTGTYTGSLTSPTLGAQLQQNILSAGGVAPASTLVSKNIKPQYLDEFILGGEHKFAGSRWSVGLNLTYRKLGKVLEDADFDGSGTYASILRAFCETQTEYYCNGGASSATVADNVVPTIGSGGYVLINPGSDIIVDVQAADGSLHEITIPAEFGLNASGGFPKAKRVYKAAEFKFDRAWDNKWGLSGSYVLASSKGNYEGGVKSDNGQDDTGLTQDFDELGWMDGTTGYLPNHRKHTFKLYGAYAITPNLRVGANAILQSPRKFGCQGTYPYGDGRASNNLATSFYCAAQVEAGNIQAGESTTQDPNGYLTPRGSVFESDWNKRIDLSAQYRMELLGLKGMTLRADVFNVFNFKSKLDFNEFGDLDNAATINPNYRRVTSYQTPRNVRLGMSIDF